MSQLNAEQVLQSFRGLKVKEAQENQILTSSLLTQIQTTKSLASAKTNIQHKLTSLSEESTTKNIKQQSQNNDLFNSIFKKPSLIFDFERTDKTLIFNKTKQSFFKKPKALQTLCSQQDISNKISKNYVLDQKQLNKNKQLEFKNNNQQKQVVYKNSNIFKRKEMPKNDFKNPFALIKNSISNTFSSMSKDQLKQKVETKAQQIILFKSTSQNNLQQNQSQNSSDTLNQNNASKNNNNKLSNQNQNKLDKIFQKINKQKIVMTQKLNKDVSTSFIDFYNQNYSKLKLKNPGRKVHQLVNIALQKFKYTESQYNKH